MRSLLLLVSLLSTVGVLPAVDDGYTDSDGVAGLGVRTGPVPLHIQAINGLQPGQGTMVRRVIPWAPAGELGLQRGDVIVAIDGTATDSRRDLRQEVWSNHPGSPFILEVLRDGERMTLTGTYGRIPERIVERLRLPSERWEERVAERQRDWLAEQTALRAAEAERRLIDEGLPALQLSDLERSAVLDLVAADSPWTFHFRWSYTAPGPSEVEL